MHEFLRGGMGVPNYVSSKHFLQCVELLQGQVSEQNTVYHHQYIATVTMTVNLHAFSPSLKLTHESLPGFECRRRGGGGGDELGTQDPGLLSSV
jgi:hypothetical protein